jgi:hypothetical protein
MGRSVIQPRFGRLLEPLAATRGVCGWSIVVANHQRSIRDQHSTVPKQCSAWSQPQRRAQVLPSDQSNWNSYAEPANTRHRARRGSVVAGRMGVMGRRCPHSRGCFWRRCFFLREFREEEVMVMEGPLAPWWAGMAERLRTLR